MPEEKKEQQPATAAVAQEEKKPAADAGSGGGGGEDQQPKMNGDGGGGDAVPEAGDANKQPQDAANKDQQPKENGANETANNNNNKSGSGSPEPPKEMRAVVLAGFGGLKCVKPQRKPEPQQPQEGEVLVRVKACGLNFQDLMARQGGLDSPPKPPFIMGFECAGDIEAVGEKVENFKVGDKVVALPEFRAWAEYVVVPATSVFALPAGMSYEEAAAITLNFTVAYILLFELANLTPGRSILMHSAGGGVGQAIAQLAKTVPNTTIFGVCSKSKHEKLKEIGNIDHLIDRSSDYSAAVKKESPDGVDIMLDCMYGEECRKGYALVKPMGRYILYGLSNSSENKSISAARFWWQVNKVPPIKLFEENKTMCGFNLRHLMYQKGNHALVQKTVNAVFKLWADGKIKPLIDSTYALEDVVEAMQKMHNRENIGKIILDPSMEPKPKPVTPAKSKSKDKKNAIQEDKKASSIDSEEGEKKKEGELTNGTTEEKAENDSKEKESS